MWYLLVIAAASVGCQRFLAVLYCCQHKGLGVLYPRAKGVTARKAVVPLFTCLIQGKHSVQAYLKHMWTHYLGY